MDKARVLLLFVKLNMIFRAGRNSLPAVIWTKPLARERKQTRCDSGADSKVWMKEDEKMFIYIPWDYIPGNFYFKNQ